MGTEGMSHETYLRRFGRPYFSGSFAPFTSGKNETVNWATVTLSPLAANIESKLLLAGTNCEYLRKDSALRHLKNANFSGILRGPKMLCVHKHKTINSGHIDGFMQDNIFRKLFDSGSVNLFELLA